SSWSLTESVARRYTRAEVLRKPALTWRTRPAIAGSHGAELSRKGACHGGWKRSALPANRPGAGPGRAGHDAAVRADGGAAASPGPGGPGRAAGGGQAGASDRGRTADAARLYRPAGRAPRGHRPRLRPRSGRLGTVWALLRGARLLLQHPAHRGLPGRQ